MKAWNISIIGLLILTAACSKSPQDQIIGKWKSMDGKSVVEFVNPELVVFNNKTHAKYTFDGTELRILGQNGNTVSGNANVTSTKMETLLNGNKEVYFRIEN